MLEFEERTIKVIIDTDKCPECETKACIAACNKFDRGTLKEKDGKPSVEHLTPDDVKRLGTECLACEYECWLRGKGAIKIEVPIPGLDEYLKKRGLA
jgi:Fe-S-cluster-containing dehydrogenase component